MSSSVEVDLVEGIDWIYIVVLFSWCGRAKREIPEATYFDIYSKSVTESEWKK